MKTILLFSLLSFLTSLCPGQSADSLQLPAVLQSEAEIRHRALMSKIGNYDNSVGKSFGDFYATDINGQPVSSKDLVGKVTFINFWFDACAPCHLIFDNLNLLYNRYKLDPNFQILSFTFDSRDQLKTNSTKYKLLYRQVSISRALCHELIGMYHGFPSNFIIDKSGKVSFGHSGTGKNGSDAFADLIIPKINSLLAE